MRGPAAKTGFFFLHVLGKSIDARESHVLKWGKNFQRERRFYVVCYLSIKRSTVDSSKCSQSYISILHNFIIILLSHFMFYVN